MKTRTHMHSITIRAAVAPDRVIVVQPGGNGRVHHQEYQVTAADGGETFAGLAEALTKALREMRTVYGNARASVAVALLPPLVHCRLIDMPGLSNDEIQRVVSRDVTSYFPVGANAHVVGVCTVRGARPGSASVLAAAAPAALIDAIHDAALTAECVVATVVPSATAWAMAAQQLEGEGSVDGRTLVAILDGHVEVLTVEHGQLTGLRRIRSDGPEQRPLIDTLAERKDIVLLGAPRLAEPIARSLAAAGLRLTMPGTPESPASPELLAAQFAQDTQGPLLMPEPLRVERRRQRTRRSVQVLAASAVLLVAAGALELWGVRRELAAVSAQRLELRGRLAGVLATRDTVTLLAERIAALRSAEMSAPRWSDALALVAEYLPRDAHLLSLRAEGDSLVLEGVARRAAPVFEAMARAPAALAVRAQGSIRREIRDEIGQVERFTLSVRLTGGTP